ncbi:MAG: metal-sulfur cluster assembly factor [Phyllobacterium sp.]|uniref:metal-sulfur cluster assembly factor n=1 Tax=Phyllobacterium sp. TaxID=1871046 RepID=UPI0030F32FD9
MDEARIEALRSSVRTSLRIILDPELGENIVDLGLIYAIDVSASGDVRVTMTTTTRACPATGFLQEAVKLHICAVPGVNGVDVDLTYEPPWSPERITGEARLLFSR